MQTRRLGRTGHHSSLAILGGAAFAMDTPDDAAEFLHEAVDAGINHLDIAPGYRLAERDAVKVCSSPPLLSPLLACSLPFSSLLFS